MKRFAVKTIFFIGMIIGSGFLYAQDAATYYKEGVALKEQKKSREAMEKFKKALALQADYPAALYEIGWCQNDLKDYTGAITSLRKVRNSWPEIPKVYFELGYAFEKTLQYDTARVLYLKCIELSPGYSLAYLQLGYIAYEKNDNPAALAYFRNYEQKAKTSPAGYLYWYRKGFCSNAVKQYDSARVALLKSMEFKKDYINTYLELGYAATRQFKADEAIGYFNTAIQLEPKNHIPYNGIGEVYRDVKKDADQAMSWYRKTLAINENERKANFGMGYCLNSKGLYTEAIVYLRRAIAAEQTYTAAYVELGYSLYKTKNYTDAGINLRKAIELSPASENAHFYLVSMYVELKDKVNAQKWLNAMRAFNSKYLAELEPKVNAL
jgi:tetratricopeptide (TPR) repeat protein